MVLFYAPNKELYELTKKFYKSLFFQSYEETNDQCILSNNKTSISLLIDPENSASIEEIKTNTENLIKHINKRDWRTYQSAITFNVENLKEIESILTANNVQFQQKPLNNPLEVYAIDPLGSIIGFSKLANPFAVKERKHHSHSHTESHNLSIGSSIATANNTNTATNDVQQCIAVMTSGGDAPGMNANVRAIIRTAIHKNCKAYVIHEGYSGLVNGGDFIKEIHWSDVNGWLSDGGTNIGTARCMEFKEREGRLTACHNMINAGITALIVCGGDGSLTGADLFRAEWPSLIKELLDTGKITQDQFDKHQFLNICGTVGSIDNDMSSTDVTIGSYSSLDRICKAIDYIDATANSHQRAFVIEVMGRHCGWLALMAGIATSADYIFIPESPSKQSEWSEHMCKVISKHRERGKRKTIVIVAEGAIDSSLNPISCNDVKDILVEKLGLDTRVTTLGHVQRGGPAVAFDRYLATMQGVYAVDAVLNGNPDTPSPMIGISENKIIKRNLVDAVKLTKSVAEAINAKDFDKVMELRDTEFSEHLKYFKAINSADFKDPSLSSENHKNFAIINVGAPAGGMNSATYAFANYCLSRGHTPYAIYNGFSGLSRHESIRSLDWLEIENWNSLGGSEIGTNRDTPLETDIGLISYYLTKYKIDGLLIVGGFEALESLHQLENSRSSYPGLRIPMVLIPATISNNVPGTEYSLGSDTCLNQLVEYCDIISQSASATRNRCFVVEVQGGNCGYIATYAQLCAGAECSYVPEEGIDLKQLNLDIQTLKINFHNDNGRNKSGRILIKSELASKALTTDVIGDIISSESNGRFDSRTAIPGHVQQGGIPSPIDRTRATRLAIKAIEFMESNFDNISKAENEIGEFIRSPEADSTAAVLGIQKNNVLFTPVSKIWDHETHKEGRMRKIIFWDEAREVADMLVGRVKV